MHRNLFVSTNTWTSKKRQPKLRGSQFCIISSAAKSPTSPGCTPTLDISGTWECNVFPLVKNKPHYICSQEASPSSIFQRFPRARGIDKWIIRELKWLLEDHIGFFLRFFRLCYAIPSVELFVVGLL